jgi:membrane-bound ClpP family serine protease
MERSMNWKISFLIGLLVIASPYRAARGEVFQIKQYGPACNPITEACMMLIRIQGAITAADPDELKRLIEQTRQEAESKHWPLDPPYVYLDTPGGDVSAALAIGRFLRKEQIAVQIDPQGICYSACVMVLAGAVVRNMQGRVGIHRPYFEVPKDKISSDRYSAQFQRMLQELRAYFREMNVNEQLADAMLRTEPEQMRVLNSAELRTYGLSAIDPVLQEIRDLKGAQERGLSRQEYMSRKALAKTQCANEATTCYAQILMTGKIDPRVSPNEVDFSQFGRPAK